MLLQLFQLFAGDQGVRVGAFELDEVCPAAVGIDLADGSDVNDVSSVAAENTASSSLRAISLRDSPVTYEASDVMICVVFPSI